MFGTEFSQNLSQYTKHQKLGEGTYDELFAAVNNNTGERVTLKQIRVRDQEEDGVPAATVREIAICKEVDHVNVHKLVEVIAQVDRITLVFERMDMDLGTYLRKLNGPLDSALLRSYAFQLLCGVAYLHSIRVLHRNINTNDLLLNRKGLLKVSNFETARIYSVPMSALTPHLRNVWYAAPETLLGAETYACEADMWSVGCVFAEMVRRTPLFRGDSEIDQLMHIFEVMGTPSDDEWPEWKSLPLYREELPKFEKLNLTDFLEDTDPLFLDLISKILVLNPRKRISAIEALQHEYFKDIPESLYNICMPEVL